MQSFKTLHYLQKYAITLTLLPTTNNYKIELRFGEITICQLNSWLNADLQFKTIGQAFCNILNFYLIGIIIDTWPFLQFLILD